MKFDILIVGAGPAGLNAVQVAAASGAAVGLVDDNALPGGQIWRQGPQHRAQGRARALLDELAARPNVTRLAGTRIVQALAGRRLLAQHSAGSLQLDYGRLIVATGARERFLPFPGWTLPGVTGAGGLQALIKGGVPVRGERVVIAGSGPLLWAAALTAREQGARIAAIVEQAPRSAIARFAGGLALTPAKLAQALRLRLGLRDTPYWCDAQVIEASGGTRLEQVRVRRSGGEVVIDCERLACGFGLVPNTQLAAALGCAVAPRPDGAIVVVDECQASSVRDVYAAGECTGVGGMELSALEGRIAAHAALGDTNAARRLFGERARYRRFAARLATAFALDPRLATLARPDTIVCRCEDVTFGELARRSSWRDAKLQTRCGMGACQGRICSEAAAFCFGWHDDHTQPVRPPLAPARIETLLQAAQED